MYPLKLLLLLVIFSMNENAEAKLRVMKYVYQKDMSEHCRRRVMPSVFLGNHVVEANSQILHFSQLEVPYSCFISIRTESGGNIILVVKLDNNSLKCSKETQSPVKVFGMGETFGGYWGPLPDVLSTSTPQVEKFYTLKTTTAEIISDEENIKEEDELSDRENSPKSAQEDSPKEESTQPTGDTRDYIRQIVPIVNITGRLVESDHEPVRAFAVDDTFDMFYNVRREPGKKYVSTIVPLMQFSMAGMAEMGSGRRGGGGKAVSNVTTPEQRFDFEYDFGAFTLDPRLMISMSGGKPAVPSKRYRPMANRRLNFRKNKGRLFVAKTSPSLRKNNLQINNSNDSWSYIEGLLKNLSGNKLEQDEKENQTESKRFSALLQRVADWQHNYSAYLSQNLTLEDPLFLDKLQKVNLSSTLKTSTSSYHKDKTKNTENVKQLSTKVNHVLRKGSTLLDMYTNTESSRLIKVSSVTHSTSPKPFKASTKIAPDVTSGITTKVNEAAKITIQKATDLATGITEKIMKLGPNITEKIVSPRDSNNTIDTTTSGDMKTTRTKTRSSTTQKATSHGPTIKSSVLSMADHASWENVVQVAPKIAGILNTTKTVVKSKKSTRRHKGKRRRRRRRKRYIQAIPIEPARPHNLTTDPDVLTTPEAMYNFVDMQDFAQLVELTDDEIQGHLALRYMRRFVGATMFDLCSTSYDHVLFFNTSRIVLALNNFTLPRMTVIATPARWLPFPGQRCNINSLECQVAGKRVCVNKLTACDGVPNCGAADIYDEDRLLCGDEGMQHNVYLAAFTFLAVLLTMLYTVHYWLKRCVPKVSEAFFIYTDGTENILYLDSIMRSPLESDSAKAVFHGNYFEDVLAIEQSAKKKKSLLKRIFGFRKKKELDDFQMVDVDLMDFHRTDHAFSFAEMEINNLANAPRAEVAVQTGDSLEMQCRSEQEENNFFFESVTAAAQKVRNRTESIDPRAGFRDIRLHIHDEEGSERRSSENSELNMLKFLREAKLSAERWNQNQRNPPVVKEEPETELKSTMYDRSVLTMNSPRDSLKAQALDFRADVPSTPFEQFAQEPSAVPGPSSLLPAGPSPRRIRFNEALTSINQEDDEDNLHGETSQMLAPEESELDPCPVPSGRDFRRFWSSNKSKKDKSKQKKHLPMH